MHARMHAHTHTHTHTHARAHTHAHTRTHVLQSPEEPTANYDLELLQNMFTVKPKSKAPATPAVSGNRYVAFLIYPCLHRSLPLVV